MVRTICPLRGLMLPTTRRHREPSRAALSADRKNLMCQDVKVVTLAVIQYGTHDLPIARIDAPNHTQTSGTVTRRFVRRSEEPHVPGCQSRNARRYPIWYARSAHCAD